MRHIAIWGIGFSGSTVLGSVLGSAPGARFAGETHWLIDGSKAIRAARQNVLTTEPSAWMHCRLCGEACPAFTPEFRLDLASGSLRRLYPAVAARLETDVLVTSDKSVSHYRRFSRFDFSAVVSFKAPVDHLISTAKKKVLSDPVPMTPDECVASLDLWCRTYESFLDTPVTGAKVFLEWPAFYPRGVPAFQTLMSALSLDGDAEQVLRTPRPGHMIGGNARVNLEELQAADGFRFKTTEAAALGGHTVEILAGHRANEILARLRHLAI